MDTILDALQEGRLFELPENDKTHALQFLAHIIEAFPEVPAGTDVVGLVMKREQATSTAIGKGWACPHTRVSFDEDLMCVIGWSPHGIDYDTPDDKPVSLLVMHLVPDNQRTHYLREISMLAKALETYADAGKLSQVGELDGVRNYLLDLIDFTMGAVGPDARAKMIRLQRAPAHDAAPFSALSNLVVEPVTLIAGPGMTQLVLAQNPGLVKRLDSASQLIEKIEADGVYEDDEWRVLRRGSITYQGGRVVYDCLAIRMVPNNSTQTR